MADRPTFASVTDVPCTCEYLQRSADDPHDSIVFDPRTAEYQFTFRRPGPADASQLIIYHCPFCGGAAPKSKRHLLFAVIPVEEEERLARLLAPLRTIRGALRRLGRPDQDEAARSRTSYPEQDGHPPTTHPHRTLFYERLSDVANVVFTEQPDGRAHWHLVGKYAG